MDSKYVVMYVSSLYEKLMNPVEPQMEVRACMFLRMKGAVSPIYLLTGYPALTEKY